MIHISFYEKQGVFYSTGKNYQTQDPIEAISQWKEEYPNAQFINAKYNEIHH